MKKLLIICIMILITSCDCNTSKFKTIQEAAEYSYFEGQKDYMNEDIRIKVDDNGCYHWSESPWNDGKRPIYDPSKICDAKETK
jgi:hypothetical protein